MPNVAELRQRYDRAGQGTPPLSSPDPHGIFWKHSPRQGSSPMFRRSPSNSSQGSPASGVSRVVGRNNGGGPPQRSLQRSSSSEFVRERLDHYKRIVSGSSEDRAGFSGMPLIAAEAETPVASVSLPSPAADGGSTDGFSISGESSASTDSGLEEDHRDGEESVTQDDLAVDAQGPISTTPTPVQPHEPVQLMQPPLIESPSVGLFSPLRRRQVRRSPPPPIDTNLSAFGDQGAEPGASPLAETVSCTGTEQEPAEPSAALDGPQEEPLPKTRRHRKHKTEPNPQELVEGDGLITKAVKMVVPPLIYIPLSFLFRVFVVIPLRTFMFWVLGWYLYIRPRKKRAKRKPNLLVVRLVGATTAGMRWAHNLFWGSFSRVRGAFRFSGSPGYSPFPWVGRIFGPFRRGIWLSVSISARTIQFGLVQLGKEMKRAWRGILNSPRTMYHAARLSWRSTVTFYRENHEDVNDIAAAFTGLGILALVGLAIAVPLLAVTGVLSYWDLQKVRGLGDLLASVGLVEQPSWVVRAMFQG